MCYDFFMDPQTTDQAASLVPAGTNLSPPPPPAVALPPTPTPVPDARLDINPSKSRGKMWLYIVISVIILALVGTSIYAFYQLRQSRIALKAATIDSANAAKEQSANNTIKNNSRDLDTGLLQYAIDNGPKDPNGFGESYPVSSKRTGVDISELAVPLEKYLTSAYGTSHLVLNHELQAFYASSTDGKYYVQVRCLVGKFETPAPVTEGNGVYNVSGGSVSFPVEKNINPDSQDKVISGLTCTQAFVTYGPQ